MQTKIINKIVTMLALGAMAALLAVCGGYFAPPLHAQGREVAPRLEGTWETTVMPDGGEPFVNITTFASGGVMIDIAPDPAVSTALGTWVRTGGSQFDIALVAFLSDQGQPFGMEKVQGVFHLDSPNSFSGPFRVDVVVDGQVVQSICGTVQATRINVEPLVPCP